MERHAEKGSLWSLFGPVWPGAHITQHTHTYTHTHTPSAHAGRGALKPCAPVVVGWPAYVSRSAIAASLGCLGVFPT